VRCSIVRPRAKAHCDTAASTASRPNVSDDGQRPLFRNETCLIGR
jgi:hypothetical protein